MADVDKAMEVVRDVKSQIEKQLSDGPEIVYRIDVGQNWHWFSPGFSLTPKDVLEFAHWILEQIEHAANDSEQAPEVDINDNET